MKELLIKVSKVKENLGAIERKQKNEFRNSMYFDINDLIEFVEPELRSNGLVLTQPISDNKVYSDIQDLDSGDCLRSGLQLPELSDPQKMVACITYYRRVTLQSLLALRAVDNDGNTKGKLTLIPGTKEWKGAVEYLGKEGTIEAIKKKYIIEDEEKLMKDVMG